MHFKILHNNLYMKGLYLFFLILIVIFCSGFSDSIINIAVTYQPNVERLEGLFKSYIKPNNNIIYTKVPRGLVLSINENLFFNNGEARIKESSLCFLDCIITLLKEIPNYCIVENHTLNNKFADENYKKDWELSITRSSNIVEYMTVYGKIPSSRVFALGFGEFMPFNDNVSKQGNLDNRIDFVIIEYEAKR